jgi:hypothetical protein
MPLLQVLQHLRADESGQRAGPGAQQPRHQQVSQRRPASCKRDVSGEERSFAAVHHVALSDVSPPAPTRSHHPFLQRHLEVADVPGKFVAHTNLGLVEAAAGNFSAAAVNHRLALRCAIILRSIEGEALACGNLGVASRSVDTTYHLPRNLLCHAPA